MLKACYAVGSFGMIPEVNQKGGAMKLAEGVDIGILQDGKRLALAQNGEILGNILPSSRVSITVNVCEDRILEVIGFIRSGPKNGNLIYLREPQVGKGIRLRRRVGFHVADCGVIYTRFPDNTVFLLELGEPRIFVVHRLSVVVDQGNYLVHECEYRGMLYQDGTKVLCPGLSYWPELVEVLPDCLPTDCISQSVPVTNLDVAADQLETKQGRVIWWSSGLGMGALDTVRGVARVFRQDILSDERPRKLVPGQMVKLTQLVIPTGKRGTMFPWQALGVRSCD